jgi:hypothetical protein
MMVRIAAPLITSAIVTPEEGPTNRELFADELLPLDFRMKRRYQMERRAFGRVVDGRISTGRGLGDRESTKRFLKAPGDPSPGSLADLFGRSHSLETAGHRPGERPLNRGWSGRAPNHMMRRPAGGESVQGALPSAP